MKNLKELCDEHLQDVLITQDFLDYRDDLSTKLYTAGRDEQKMLVSVDCVIAEYELLRLGVVEPPLSFAHDVIIDGVKIDIKVSRGTWFTVSDRKLHWYRECVQRRTVDDFAFLAYTKSRSKPFILGDRVSLRFIKQVPAKEVLYNLRRSRYNGFYYQM